MRGVHGKRMVDLADYSAASFTDPASKVTVVRITNDLDYEETCRLVKSGKTVLIDIGGYPGDDLSRRDLLRRFNRFMDEAEGTYTELSADMVLLCIRPIIVDRVSHVDG